MSEPTVHSTLVHQCIDIDVVTAMGESHELGGDLNREVLRSEIRNTVPTSERIRGENFRRMKELSSTLVSSR